jgi:hypothetical protein
MRNTTLVLALAALTTVAACKKKDAPAAASGSATSEGPISAKVTVTATGSAEAPAGSAAPAAPAAAHVDPGCKPGSYNPTNPDFCAEVPADFKPGTDEGEAGNHLLEFTDPGNHNFSLKWSDEYDKQNDIDMVHAYAHPTDKTMTSVANGDLPGGAGAFAHYKYATGVEQEDYLYVGKKADVTCSFQATKPDVIAKLEAICKTVKVP